MKHPADLWTPPEPDKRAAAFEMVRARGMKTIHQKRTAEEAALCGLLPPETKRGRWTIYPALPKDAAWCKECTIAAGTELAKAGKLSKTTIANWEAWPFKDQVK